MVIPVGPAYGMQEMYRVAKDEQGKVSEKRLYGVTFVPLIRRANASRHQSEI